ncbi:MAG: hypothetical protein HWE07_05020 [Cytophagia bacterium]|nr:hypothetical protein [Cytophagia bacterium]
MKIETHYIKNHDFKTVEGSGIFGGLTNNGQININFFTDRAPIPKKIILDVDPSTGKIIQEIERDSKEGVIREVQFGVLLNIETAKNIVGWLNQKIEEHQQQSISVK